MERGVTKEITTYLLQCSPDNHKSILLCTFNFSGIASMFLLLLVVVLLQNISALSH